MKKQLISLSIVLSSIALSPSLQAQSSVPTLTPSVREPVLVGYAMSAQPANFQLSSKDSQPRVNLTLDAAGFNLQYSRADSESSLKPHSRLGLKYKPSLK